jgi:glycosyltransferase involved in cell wall biosynthesis
MLGQVDQISRTHVPRVVHVITDAGPHPYFRTLIAAGGMERSGLIVGCLGPPGPLQDDMHELGVETFALGAQSRRAYPVALVRLARLLRRHRTEVVQAHLVDGSVVGLAAARLARVPVAVMTAHHSHELPFHGRRLVWEERVCVRLANHIIAPSQQVADTLVKFTGVPREKIEVVRHGFDLERLDPGRVDGSSVRRELGLEGELVFGAIGRIYRLKNYPALLQAFAMLAQELPDARLVIVGGGDEKLLIARAQELGIGDRVFVLGPRPDVPELLAAFDVFVHPAIAESFGMVIVEAMAMARPVVSTPVGIAAEVIQPGLTGILLASSQPGSIADGLRAAAADDVQRRALGSAAREYVATFSASAMAQRYSGLYRTWLR